MKLTVILLFTTVAFAFGQKMKLDVSNPMPRVNDELEVILSVESNQREIIAGRIMLKEIFLDTGLMTIGPFKASVNNQTYETDKLQLRVGAELPTSIVDGFWVRTFSFNSKLYIVLEQRISDKISKEKISGNEVIISTNSAELLFAELNEELLEDNGVAILTARSSTGTKIIKLNDSRGTFTYKNTVYIYELNPEYGSPFKITKEYFRDFPRNAEIADVWIKK